jgi:uncharacterized membrane protein
MKWNRALPALSLAYMLMACLIKGLEHAAYQMEWDLGTWDQAIWQVSRGLFPYSTVLGFSKLSDHADALCFLISPFYAIYPTVVWMFLAQALFTVIAAFGIQRLALYFELSPRLAFFSAALFLLAPGTVYQTLYPLHMEALAMAMWVWALYRLLRFQDLRFAVVASILSAFCKEESPLAFCTLALYLYLFHPRLRRSACILGLTSTGMLALMFGVIAPAFRGAGPNLMSVHYGNLGSSMPQVVLHCLIWPGVLFRQLCTVNNALALLEVLLPTAGLCFLYPPAAVIYLPLWLANAISDPGSGQHDIFYHHHTAQLAPIYYALIMALRRRPRWVGAAGIATLILLVTLNPLRGRFSSSEQSPLDWAQMLQLIPPQARAMVPVRAVSHISEREWAYMYPRPCYPLTWPAMRRVAPVDYVLVNDPGAEDEVHKLFVAEALTDPDFHLISEHGGLMLLQRGALGHQEGLAKLPPPLIAIDQDARLRIYAMTDDAVSEEALLRSRKSLSVKQQIRLGLLASKLKDFSTAKTAFQSALANPDVPEVVRADLTERLRKLP